MQNHGTLSIGISSAAAVSLISTLVDQASMTRSTTADVTFRHPFTLKGLEDTVPPGTYRVDTEEERIEGLSFLAYRRLATFIRLPMAGHGSGSTQSLLVDPKELEQALVRDAVADAATY
jgi:hypothetical protein